MTHAASRRACHPRGQSTSIWKLAEIFGLADPLHTGRLRDAGLQVLRGHDHALVGLSTRPAARETLGPIDTAVWPDAFAARSTRSRPARPSQGSTAAPTRGVFIRARGPSRSARTPRSSPPSHAPVRSSRSARDRHRPPPSTRADRRPVYPRTLRQHREARIMSGHSRSATAHPGIRPPDRQARASSNHNGSHHRPVISSILRSRRGPGVAKLGHQDIHLRTQPLG
jgi:hypothetical protein